MEWPLYFKEQIDVGNLESCIGICTLWTKRTRITKEVDKSLYAAVGNLYSKDGINFLLRNVLANPKIRYLILCGMDRLGSGETLLRLTKKGVNENWQIVGDEVQIDKEIDAFAIEAFRKNVHIIDLRGRCITSEIEKTSSELTPLPAFGQPRTFPISMPETEILPSENSVFSIRGKFIAEVWVKILFTVMRFGKIEKTQYSMLQKEIIDITSVIEEENPDDPRLPDWLSLTKTQIDAYSEQVLKPIKIPELSYTYGERLFNYNGVNQIKFIVDDLKKTKYSRRGVATLWDPRRDPATESPPCLNLIQAMIRSDKLLLTAYIRSNDMFRAWPENAFSLRKLQKLISEEVGGLPLGDLAIVSQSAHIYEDCWNKAEDMIKNHFRDFVINPRFQRDPRGSFVIQIENSKIAVYHYSPSQQRLQKFTGVDIKQIYMRMAPFISLVDHAIYLGTELKKAELALTLGIKYTQDVELDLLD